ncbi:MAG: hypothetical protein UY47_C0001G0019 [Parcubacteria group bacterium GW2011_GWB1_49_7]|nr:MAG: hypothetical protein UY47_C0001G0019 [Parcubacteria group bacterium GW2011_GWB1_49_7]
MLLGLFFASDSLEGSQWFLIFVTAVILSKQIEVLNKLDK